MSGISRGEGVCRARRLKFDLTQEKFAAMLGLSAVSVNRWENGHWKPSGLNAVIFTMLDSALKLHPSTHVAQALQKADGAHVELVLVLAKLISGEKET